LNVKASGETRDIPVCLLYSVNPDFFAGNALFSVGVDRMLDKANQEQIARFANPFRSLREYGWSAFTERARRVVFFAQEEAISWGENYVSTEHLLLGLVREDLSSEPTSVAVRILEERFGLTR